MPSRHRHDPADCLADIVENTERIEDYLAGMDRAAFERDGRTRDAVERCVERVCEAVTRLGEQAEMLMPGHPWGDIRGTGNRLRHAYDRVSLDVIWATVRHDLPALAADARRALARLCEDGADDAG
ncbi:MAG TPA: HepT-like ribonuclease domain-containing protein [Acetobacteraceae bacterium]